MEDLRFRISQDELKYIYESANKRMRMHPNDTQTYKAIIDNCSCFANENEALEFVLKEVKKNNTDYQIWASIEKEDNIYKITDCWYVTDNWRIKLALEYTGMAQIYDTIRISKIINSTN